ncbi:hypothetical protein [Okeania sp. SIO2C9]|nr:hypothetical protein [Okeania sp. SIO2C9]
MKFKNKEEGRRKKEEGKKIFRTDLVGKIGWGQLFELSVAIVTE